MRYLVSHHWSDLNLIEWNEEISRHRFHGVNEETKEPWPEPGTWQITTQTQAAGWMGFIKDGTWRELTEEQAVPFMAPVLRVTYLKPPDLSWPPERHFD